MTREEFDGLIEAVRDDGGTFASSRMRLWAAIEQSDRDARLCAYLEWQSSAWQMEATRRQGQMNAFESRAEKAERAVEAVRALAFGVVNCRVLTGGEVLEAIQHAEAGKA